jgi:hypothetical protein
MIRTYHCVVCCFFVGKEKNVSLFLCACFPVHQKGDSKKVFKVETILSSRTA